MSKRWLSIFLALLLGAMPLRATDVQFTGVGTYVPGVFYQSGAAPTFDSTLVIDATGEKAAFVGQVWFPVRTGSKTINKVQFRFGAVTKAGGSALTVSLQDVSLTASPIQPDGTQDQYRAIGNGEATFASNTWYTSGLVTSDGTDTGTKRSVAFGDLLSVVLEYDGSGRLGADSVVMSGFGVVSTSVIDNRTRCALYTASWATGQQEPIIVLEFSDATFGTLHTRASLPIKAANTHTFNSSTAVADEYALEIQFPFPVRVDGAWVMISMESTGSDYEVILYSGTTALQTVTIDANTIGTAAASVRIIELTFPETALTASTLYRLAFRPTTATEDINIYSADVDNAGFLDLMGGGQTFAFSTRLDQGAWSATTATRRIFAGIRISSLSDGAGGGSSITTPARISY